MTSIGRTNLSQRSLRKLWAGDMEALKDSKSDDLDSIFARVVVIVSRTSASGFWCKSMKLLSAMSREFLAFYPRIVPKGDSVDVSHSDRGLSHLIHPVLKYVDEWRSRSLFSAAIVISIWYIKATVKTSLSKSLFSKASGGIQMCFRQSLDTSFLRNVGQGFSGARVADLVSFVFRRDYSR